MSEIGYRILVVDVGISTSNAFSVMIYFIERRGGLYGTHFCSIACSSSNRIIRKIVYMLKLLDVHHIDSNIENGSISNMMVLCPRYHVAIT